MSFGTPTQKCISSVVNIPYCRFFSSFGWVDLTSNRCPIFRFLFSPKSIDRFSSQKSRISDWFETLKNCLIIIQVELLEIKIVALQRLEIYSVSEHAADSSESSHVLGTFLRSIRDNF